MVNEGRGDRKETENFLNTKENYKRKRRNGPRKKAAKMPEGKNEKKGEEV